MNPLKIINLNSRYELSAAQVAWAQLALSPQPLADEIPIFLLSPDSMPSHLSWRGEAHDREGRWDSEFPPTEWLGFYQRTTQILGIDTPAIGLCPERIMRHARNEQELTLLTAKVIVHEFGHARMHLIDKTHQASGDEFCHWMQEALANWIVLERFRHLHHERHRYSSWRRGRGGDDCCDQAHVENRIDPYDFVRDFISRQPDEYRLGIDFHRHRPWRGYILESMRQARFLEKLEAKQALLDYVKRNVGQTEEKVLEGLVKALADG